MKKWKRIVSVCLLPLLLITILFFGSLLRVSSEKNVEHYLSSLPTDGLVKIGIYGLGEHVELYTVEEQKEILNHLSKIEAILGGEGSDTKAEGGIILSIKLFYEDGRTELVTLPAFTYPTLLGNRDFYLSIDGEKAVGQTKLWAPFRKYFELLQD